MNLAKTRFHRCASFHKFNGFVVFIIGVSLLTWLTELSRAQERPVRIEGVVVGNYIGPEQPPPERRLYFKLWQSGEKWIYQASSYSNIDQHLDGGTVSYDGTNLYHFAPAARGTQIADGQPYQGMERIESNPEWRFGGGNGPLWWAYASSGVLQKDGPIPTFLIEFGNADFSLKRDTIAETNRRVGPVHATITIPVRGMGEQIIAEIHPLATNEVDGIVFITKCEVITYGFTRARSGANTNSPPTWMAVNKWEISLDRFGLQAAPISYVPRIPAPGGTNSPVLITTPKPILPFDQPFETNTDLLPRG
jgi:hypothetical protein